MEHAIVVLIQSPHVVEQSWRFVALRYQTTIENRLYKAIHEGGFVSQN